MSGTISDAIDHLSHGAFAPFTSRDGIDGGMNMLMEKKGSINGSSIIPQMLGVKIYDSLNQKKIGSNQFNMKQSIDLIDIIDVMPVAIKNQHFNQTDVFSNNN
jgi:hypothetical protein